MANVQAESIAYTLFDVQLAINAHQICAQKDVMCICVRGQAQRRDADVSMSAAETSVHTPSVRSGDDSKFM